MGTTLIQTPALQDARRRSESILLLNGYGLSGGFNVLDGYPSLIVNADTVHTPRGERARSRFYEITFRDLGATLEIGSWDITREPAEIFRGDYYEVTMALLRVLSN